MSRMRIGELLVAAKVITPEQLAQALEHPRREGERLGDVLLSLGMISEAQLAQALSQQLAVPWVSLYHVDFSRPLLNLVSRAIADKYCVVPVLVRKTRVPGQPKGAKAQYVEELFVAMDDPSNDVALAEVSQYCGFVAKPMLAARSDIRAAIRVYYHGNLDEEPAPLPPPSAPEPPAPPPVPPAVPAAAPVPEPPPSVSAASTPASAPAVEPEPKSERGIPRPRRGPAVPMVSLTLLDGTTIQLPARRRSPSSPQITPTPGSENELTARDLVSALRAVSHGADASEILGQAPRWEPIVATLLSVLLRKGLIADWEFIEEYRKI